MFSMAKTKNINCYKYMSDEEEADFNKRVLNLLENTNCKEIQIHEEKGFTDSIGDGERVYIVEIFEKDRPEFDDLGFAEAVAVMGHEEVKEFEKSLKAENKVEISWIDDLQF